MISYKTRRAIVFGVATAIFTPVLLDANIPLLFDSFFKSNQHEETLIGVIVLFLPGIFSASYFYRYKLKHYYTSLGWLTGLILYRLHEREWDFYRYGSSFDIEKLLYAFLSACFVAFFVYFSLRFLGFDANINQHDFDNKNK